MKNAGLYLPALRDGVVVFDGGLGTQIQARDLTAEDYGGGALDWIERTQPFGAGSDPSNITDAGYPVGSIQVPGGIEPIILHRDAVSGGGYAMVATVISADMDVVAQCSPGTQTRFRPVTLDEALEARAQAGERRRRLLAL